MRHAPRNAARLASASAYKFGESSINHESRQSERGCDNLRRHFSIARPVRIGKLTGIIQCISNFERFQRIIPRESLIIQMFSVAFCSKSRRGKE
jgi:hypothetical protein